MKFPHLINTFAPFEMRCYLINLCTTTILLRWLGKEKLPSKLHFIFYFIFLTSINPVADFIVYVISVVWIFFFF